ncbi:hypothetical protein BH10ACI3_BH10ACI3_02310 [soil metagenome]
MFFKCTLKVRNSLKLRDKDLSTTVEVSGDELDCWYCNSFYFDRRKCLIWTHGTTLFTVLAPCVRQEDLRRFGGLFRLRAREVLALDGVSQSDIDRLIDDGPDHYAKTDRRSVRGTMNDHVLGCRWYAYDNGFEGTDFNDLNYRLNHTPLGAFKYQYSSERLKLFIESLMATGKRR